MKTLWSLAKISLTMAAILAAPFVAIGMGAAFFYIVVSESGWAG